MDVQTLLKDVLKYHNYIDYTTSSLYADIEKHMTENLTASTSSYQEAINNRVTATLSLLQQTKKRINTALQRISSGMIIPAEEIRYNESITELKDLLPEKKIKIIPSEYFNQDLIVELCMGKVEHYEKILKIEINKFSAKASQQINVMVSDINDENRLPMEIPSMMAIAEPNDDVKEFVFPKRDAYVFLYRDVLETLNFLETHLKNIANDANDIIELCYKLTSRNKAQLAEIERENNASNNGKEFPEYENDQLLVIGALNAAMVTGILVTDAYKRQVIVDIAKSFVAHSELILSLIIE